MPARHASLTGKRNGGGTGGEDKREQRLAGAGSGLNALQLKDVLQLLGWRPGMRTPGKAPGKAARRKAQHHVEIADIGRCDRPVCSRDQKEEETASKAPWWKLVK